MKKAPFRTLVKRTETLAAAWALTVGMSLSGVAALLTLWWGQNQDLGRWAWVLALGVGPGAAALAIAFAVRRHRNAKAAPQPVSGSKPHAPVPGLHPHAAPPAQRSLAVALGAPHLRELRAQVDMLRTMATLERMGPALAGELRHSSVSTLALQAAVSAQVVRNILGDPDLASELQRSRIRMDRPGIESLQEDLLAISMSLAVLSERARDEEVSLTPYWTLIAEREKLTAGMPAVDRLLVQSTLLLSAVSDMARILATLYERFNAQGTRPAEDAPDAGEERFDDPELAAGWADVPVWKFN
jgi:hypothetical protein